MAVGLAPALVSSLRERRKKRIGIRIIAERLANVRVPVHITRPEHETPAKLERVRAQAVLLVSGRAGPGAGFCVITAKKMQHIRRPKSCHPISLALLVH